MGRTLTNNFSLQYAIEQSLGVLPGSPEWKLLEPNAISTFGATITTVARSPISKNRQRRKGTVTDLDSAVEFDGDLTLEHFIDFIEGFCFSSFVGAEKTVPTAVTGGATDEYTIPAISAALAQNTLVFARGFSLSANNGLKLVDAGATVTTIPVTTDLEDEAPAATQNVSVEVCGYRSAAGDLEVDANGNLISTVLDFTTLGLTLGQAIWIGGDAALNQFSNAENSGFARVMGIAANLLTLDKKSQAFVVEAGAAQEVDIYFGRFVRNVSVDDGDFLERSFTFEGAYQNLASPGPGDAYEYAKGNYCNTAGFELPLTDKATVSFAFVGTDTDVPTEVRETNADSPVVPVQTGAFNTSADIARLRIQEVDETGLTTDFKSLTLNINNNVSPEKVLAQLGAKYMNSGNFEIDLEAQLLFTNPAVVTAIRNNTRVTMDFSIKNDDGGILVDIPSMTLGGGDREFPVNESILINTTAQAYGDTTLGSSIGVSLFPYIPSA
jgi:hypothetical protein